MEYREFPITTKRGKVIFPTVDLLKAAPLVGRQHREGWASPLMIRCAENERDSFVKEVEEWFSETAAEHRKFQWYGIFGFKEFAYRIDRSFLGIIVYFVDHTDAVHMKLCMADRCDF